MVEAGLVLLAIVGFVFLMSEKDKVSARASRAEHELWQNNRSSEKEIARLKAEFVALKKKHEDSRAGLTKMCLIEFAKDDYMEGSVNDEEFTERVLCIVDPSIFAVD